MRLSNKSIGAPRQEIPVRMRLLVDDTRAQIELKTHPNREIVVRFHRRLVAVHVFPNGNGRHARQMADLLLKDLAGQPFDWGRRSLATAGEPRNQCLNALRAADTGDYRALFAFLAIRS